MIRTFSLSSLPVVLAVVTAAATAAAQTPPPPSTPPAAPTAPEPASSPFRVAVSYDINGQFTSLTCGDQPSTLTTVAGQIAAEPVSLVIDSGDLLGASAVTQLTVAHDVDGLSAAVQAAGIRVLAVGHRDISSDRASFLAGVRALAAHGVPHVLSNLHCAPDHHALCDAVSDADDPPVLLDTPAGRTAVISVMSPGTLASIAHDRAEGLTLEPYADSIPRLMTAARAAGAAHIVVTLDGTDHHEFEDALSIAALFAPGAGPDMVVVNELPEGVGSVGTLHAGVPLVAALAGRVTVIQPGIPEIAHPAHDGTAAPAVTDFVTTTTHWLCENYRHPLPGGALTSALDQPAFSNLLLDVLRETTHAEVGIINHAAVRAPRGLFPLESGVTELAVEAALPFEDSVQVTSLLGVDLKALATSPAAANFNVRGVTVAADGTVTINGRPEDDLQWYRIVTTGFISQGVGHLFGDHAPDFVRYRQRSLQDTLLAWLHVTRSGDLRARVSDPARNVRWHLRWTLDGSYTSTDIYNPSSVSLRSGYTDTQLTRAESSALRLDTEFRAVADDPSYLLENSLRAQYAIVRSVPVGGPSTGLVPTTDLITERTDLTWRAYDGATHWYDPQPYAALFIETEFARAPPPPGTMAIPNPPAPPFHFEVRPSIGARFDLLDRLAFNLGVGADNEFGDGWNPLMTFIAGINLKPGRLFSLGGRIVQAQALIEASWANPWVNSTTLNASSVTIRGSAKIVIPIFDPIALTMGYDVYARNQNGTPWGISGDGLLGLRITLDHAIQTF